MLCRRNYLHDLEYLGRPEFLADPEYLECLVYLADLVHPEYPAGPECLVYLEIPGYLEYLEEFPRRLIHQTRIYYLLHQKLKHSHLLKAHLNPVLLLIVLRIGIYLPKPQLAEFSLLYQKETLSLYVYLILFRYVR